MGMSVMSLRARGGRLLLECKNYPAIKKYRHIQKHSAIKTFPADLDQEREGAEAIAHDIAAQHERHLGFCYEELDRIVKSFRYWPPGRQKPINSILPFPVN
ncbi:hypothetical protein F4678DRAFT_453898 [Xylaria arbuscula]|nr:hypothetical protein F4678DRAFT_453898 [Xylaria arbuscula]